MIKKKSLKEHLERMKYVYSYQINESPKYKEIVGEDAKFDTLPEYLMKEEDQAITSTGDTTSTGSTIQPITGITDNQNPTIQQPENNVENTSPEKKVLELQLDALKKMSYKIEDLGNVVDSLNKRMEMFSNEVENVKEPSDKEKFDNRKLDSHPYFYNLNDLWDGNNFKNRMDQFSKGYVKTEDGYVADFDDLPKLAPHEVKASFHNY
jgi:hypothetical protein